MSANMWEPEVEHVRPRRLRGEDEITFHVRLAVHDDRDAIAWLCADPERAAQAEGVCIAIAEGISDQLTEREDEGPTPWRRSAKTARYKHRAIAGRLAGVRRFHQTAEERAEAQARLMEAQAAARVQKDQLKAARLARQERQAEAARLRRLTEAAERHALRQGLPPVRPLTAEEEAVVAAAEEERQERHRVLMEAEAARHAEERAANPDIAVAGVLSMAAKGYGRIRQGQDWSWDAAVEVLAYVPEGHPMRDHVVAVLAWASEVRPPE